MYTEELNTTQSIARRAGELLMRYYNRDKSIQSKGDSWNLVTKVDLESEELIVRHLKEAFPDYAIFAEETGQSTQSAELTWVIDPLDGTNNYAHRFPMFSLSIALYRAGHPQLTVIFDPLHDELFHAVLGGGAFLNDEPISVSAVTDLEKSLLATGFYYERGELMKRTLRQIEAFLTHPINGVRRCGSACLDLCNVAAGRLDGFWELNLGPWDYAGGVLIVTEAGGKVSAVDGGPFDLMMKNVLASNGHLHQPMLDVLHTVS